MKIYTAFQNEFESLLVAVKWFARAAAAGGAVVPQALENLAEKMISEGSRMRPRPESLLRLVRNAQAIALRDMPECNTVAPNPIRLEWGPYCTKLIYEAYMVDSQTPATIVTFILANDGEMTVRITGREEAVRQRFAHADGCDLENPFLELVRGTDDAPKFDPPVTSGKSVTEALAEFPVPKPSWHV